MAPNALFQFCFVAGLTSLVFAVTTITKGKGGVECGGVRCLKRQATCETGYHGNQTCVCDPDHKAQNQGDGTLACYKKNKRFAFICSEPIVDTYDRHKYHLNLPCRVMMTKFTSRLKLEAGTPDYVGECQCEVFAWQRKHYGKFYPHGYDASCKMVRTDTYEESGWSYRLYGLATDGIYNFTELGVREYRPNGPWNDESVSFTLGDLTTEIEYDSKNNVALLEQKNCGLRMDLRPYDITKGRYQTQKNGIGTAINCAHHQELLDASDVILSGPADGEHNGYTWEDMYTSTLLTPEEFFLYKALASVVEQNQPGASSECVELKQSALVCDSEEKVKAAMDQCKWLLNVQPFIKCVDRTENGHVILGLARRCFDQACGSLPCHAFFLELNSINYSGDPGKCNKDALRYKVPKLDQWLKYDFC